MDVFTPAEREDHIQTTRQLIHALQGVQEIAHGYAFTFPNESGLIIRIAEFIGNERLCCPFLKFNLNVFSNGEPITLALTGPSGTQEFLRAEFDGAFQ
jgi:hypothetical protein